MIDTINNLDGGQVFGFYILMSVVFIAILMFIMYKKAK